MVVSSLTFLRLLRRAAGVPGMLFTLWVCASVGAEPVSPQPPTLAQALAAAPPASGVLLAVGAERVTLAGNAEAGVDPQDIASFGCEEDVFGSVTAVAPSTMVVLNEDPVAPDVTTDLRPTEALRCSPMGVC